MCLPDVSYNTSSRVVIAQVHDTLCEFSGSDEGAGGFTAPSGGAAESGPVHGGSQRMVRETAQRGWGQYLLSAGWSPYKPAVLFRQFVLQILRSLKVEFAHLHHYFKVKMPTFTVFSFSAEQILSSFDSKCSSVTDCTLSVCWCEQENIEKNNLQHQEEIKQLWKEHKLQLEVHTHTFILFYLIR